MLLFMPMFVLNDLFIDPHFILFVHVKRENIRDDMHIYFYRHDKCDMLEMVIVLHKIGGDIRIRCDI